MRGSPVVKNRCDYIDSEGNVCNKELCSNHSKRCRKHYDNRAADREKVKAEDDDDGGIVIEDLKCPKCGKGVKYHEGFHHKMLALCRPTHLTCTGSECHWSYLAEREVEHDN